MDSSHLSFRLSLSLSHSLCLLVHTDKAHRCFSGVTLFVLSLHPRWGWEIRVTGFYLQQDRLKVWERIGIIDSVFLKSHCWFSSGLIVSSKQTLKFLTWVQIEHVLLKAISRVALKTLKAIYVLIFILRKSYS